MFNQTPVTNNGRPDQRYTITKEFCGYKEPRFVVRFCGDWIGQSKFYNSAVMLAVGNNTERKGCLVIEAIEESIQ